VRPAAFSRGLFARRRHLEGDAAAIRKVISDQLDAFKRDDGPLAFSLATAGIRAQFGTPEVFMDMVRTQYAVVYRPKSVQFQSPEDRRWPAVQPVRMTDAAGAAWLAIYPMLREAAAAAHQRLPAAAAAGRADLGRRHHHRRVIARADVGEHGAARGARRDRSEAST